MRENSKKTMEMMDNREMDKLSGNILIVDDEPDVLMSVSEILQAMGFNTITAQTGAESLDAVMKYKPDLVLLDIRLPDIDGFEVCRRLRKDERSRHIPVIFLSALIDTSDMVNAFASGGSDYIVKPFREKELIARIKLHMERSRKTTRLECMNIELEREIIEKTRMEEELRENETRLRTVIESLPFDFFLIGEDGRYVMQNTACRQNWGDIVGRFPRDICPDSRTLALWEKNNRRAFGGEVVKGEEVVHLKEGDKYIYNIVSPISDGDVIKGILGVNIDITELRWIKDRLSETKAIMARMTRMINECPKPILQISREGNIIFANKASQIVLITWKYRIGERLSQKIMKPFLEVYESGIESYVDLNGHDGSVVKLKMVPDEGEALIYIFGQ